MKFVINFERPKKHEVAVSTLRVGEYFMSGETGLYMRVEETEFPGNGHLMRGPRNAVRVDEPDRSGGQTYWFPDEPSYYVTPVDRVEVTAHVS